jgi:hypothetical protein
MRPSLKLLVILESEQHAVASLSAHDFEGHQP